MLSRIRILQIGDIHLPTSAVQGAAIDAKDKKFPVALKNIISRSPLKTVFRRIYEFIAQGDIGAILFMGDLTDTGNLDGYNSCCRYIATALQLGSNGLHKDIPVGIVPGNHDISRPLARAAGITTKFAPLVAALHSVGLPPLPIRAPVKMPIANQRGSADIYLLNSCWGCGEDEYIPEPFRASIAEAIHGVLSDADSDKAARIYYENQLDTPAISADSVSQVVNDINAQPATHVPVIVAHHNLLPQRMTRLAPYTELVNSGALRSSLLDLVRPMIFLHGHIHDEPIEILHAPHGMPLVTISAPEAVKGCNVIELLFTSQGLVVSCRIVPWRFDGSGVFRHAHPISIPLLANRRRSANSNLARLYAKLLERGQCYWQDILDYAIKITPSVTEDQVIEMLELLLADCSIAIENYDHPSVHWLVRAEV